MSTKVESAVGAVSGPQLLTSDGEGTTAAVSDKDAGAAGCDQHLTVCEIVDLNSFGMVQQEHIAVLE